MYSVIDRWETLPHWSVTVVDIADGTQTKSRIDVCSNGDGWSICMLDIDAVNVPLTASDQLRFDPQADTPWAALARLNGKLFYDDMTIASACLGVCSASGLVRVAFADFPSMYVEERGTRIRRISGGGAPLGLFAQMRFPEKVCLLELGEAVMFLNNGAQLLIDDDLVKVRDLFAGRLRDRDSLPKLRFAATAITVRRTGFMVARPSRAVAESLVCA